MDGSRDCNIRPGDIVAIWGCGPVGQFAIRSAFLMGAERVIAIDRFDYRLRLAEKGGAEPLNYEQVDDLIQLLKDITGGIGPDSCMDAGEWYVLPGHTVPFLVDRAKQAMKLSTDRPNVLRQCIQACRKGGTVSVPGVYGGFLDKIPFGSFINKGLTMKTGQTHMMRYMRPLFERIERGEIDPSFVISHRVPIDDAPRMYKVFRDKQDQCTKVVLDPWADGARAA